VFKCFRREDAKCGISLICRCSSASSKLNTMGEDRERHSASKHKRSRGRDEHKSKKKYKSEHTSHKRKSHTEAVNITDDDANDDDMWIEKNIDNDGERVRIYLFCLRDADMFCSLASRNGYSNCREPEDHDSCNCRRGRPTAAI